MASKVERRNSESFSSLATIAAALGFLLAGRWSGGLSPAGGALLGVLAVVLVLVAPVIFSQIVSIRRARLTATEAQLRRVQVARMVEILDQLSSEQSAEPLNLHRDVKAAVVSEIARSYARDFDPVSASEQDLAVFRQLLGQWPSVAVKES